MTRAAPQSPPGEAPPGTPTRVLVADDEDGTLSLEVTILTHAGFTVISARDGLEALDLARQSPPDIALLDVMMPRMDGREVCRRMAAEPALTHVPVILQSSASEADIDWRGCGADAFLAKPFNLRELPPLVRRHLSSRAGSDRPRARRLTDEEVQEMAMRIRQAVRRRPGPSQGDDILAGHRELSLEDEGRVEAALIALLNKAASGGKPEHPAKGASARRKSASRGPDDAS